MLKMRRSQSSLLPPVEVLSHVYKIALFCLLVVSILFSQVASYGTGENKIAASQTGRDRRSVSQQVPGPSESRLDNIVRQYEAGQDQNLMQYTPTTPRPEDVNCHVDVPTVQRVGGVCVPFGDTMGCQAGVFLEFNDVCLNMALAGGNSRRDATRSQDTRGSERQRRRGPSRRRQLEMLGRRNN